MKKMRFILLSAILLLANFTLNIEQAHASHVAGADVTYECLGGDTFLIRINGFRDCSGISLGGLTPTITVGAGAGTGLRIIPPVAPPIPCNSPQVLQPFTAVHTPSPLPFAGGGREVSQLCGAALPNSRCNTNAAGALPGLVQHVWEAVVILPPCNSWTLRFEPPCCRNTTATLVGQPGGPTVTAVLNNLEAPCNSSPQFEAQPIPYVCAGQQVCYNFGTTEPDGDSLVFSLVAALVAGGAPATYQAPLSPTNPIASVTPAALNSATGELCFIPIGLGNYVIVVEVEEYRNGILIGTVRRDVQVVVQTCPNLLPTQPGGFANFTGTGSQIGPKEIEICVGENFTVEIPFRDPDPNDSLELRSNVTQVLSGATFTVVYPNAPTSYDTAVAVISWTAIPLAGNFYSFFVEAGDGACPVPGLLYGTYSVEIVNSTFAGPDQTICQFTQTADILVVGGNQFQWSIISGDLNPATIDTSSQTMGKQITVSPTVTSCYQVVSNLSAGCKNTDTICIRVAPNYNIDITDDTLICAAQEIPLDATPSDPTQNYTYKWNNGQFLSNSNIKDPLALPDRPTTFTVTIESDSGCIKQEDVFINISNPFPRNIRPIVDDTIICQSGTVNFDIEWEGNIPSSCGAAFQPCIGDPAVYPSGVSANLNNPTGFGAAGFPAPFHLRNPSAKQQFLYRAADLLADGVVPGQIQGLAFEVVNPGNSPIANNYTVRLGCTNLAALAPGAFETGLTLVRNTAPLAITQPITNIPFDQFFDWDGQSNIIVEICFDNTGVSTGIGSSATTPFRPTPYASCAFNFSSTGTFASNQCPNFAQNGASPINGLPDIQFIICSGVNEAGFNISWLPTGAPGGFTTPTNIKTPSANVTLTTDSIYTLIVTDTFGVCFDTSQIKINTVSEYDVKPRVSELCVNGSSQFFSARTPYNILPRPDGGFWSGAGIINDSLGLWDPAVSGIGTHWVYYEVTGDACAKKDSTEVEVLPEPDATITTEGPFCENETAIQLQALNPGGIWYSTQFPTALDSVGLLNASLVSTSKIRVVHELEVGGCIERDTTEIELVEGFTASILPVDPICPESEILQMSALHPGGTWIGTNTTPNGIFDPTGIPADTSILVVLDSAGACGDRDSILIRIDSIPSIVFEHLDASTNNPVINPGEPPVFCSNENIPIEIRPKASNRSTWNHINNWVGLGQPVYNPATMPAGIYKSVYSVTGMNGCKNSDTLTIVIAEIPGEPEVVDDTICLGESAVLKAIKDSTDFFMIWYRDPLRQDSITMGEEITLNGLTQDTTVYVSQKSALNCYSEPIPVRISISPAVNAQFTSSSLTGPEPLEVFFFDESETFGTNATYNWYYFIGGQDTIFSNETNPSYVFNYSRENLSGDFMIMLEIFNQFGCKDTATLKIVVDAVAELVIPNVFTPPMDGASGDGFNDEFAPIVEGMRTFEAIIYNRWGRKVGEMSLANPTWDGRDMSSGELMPDGVYFYVIKGEAFNGTIYDENGTVTLIRQQ